MSDRVVRDELLTSERYWSLSSDSARLLFVHLMLRADDLWIFRAANYTVRSTCFGVTAPGAEVTMRRAHARALAGLALAIAALPANAQTAAYSCPFCDLRGAQMANRDKDFRYMASSDLLTELGKFVERVHHSQLVGFR